MLLLLIVDEFMNLCLECCWVMFFTLIHSFNIDICVVVIKLSLFDEFCENGLEMEKFDFGEL